MALTSFWHSRLSSKNPIGIAIRLQPECISNTSAIRPTHTGKSSLSSCSQKRSTLNPFVSRVSVILWSRWLFRSIFAFQKHLFFEGMCPQLGQPCQKQPSTKTASSASEKKKSGFPRTSFAFKRQPPIPVLTRAYLRRFSVVALPLPRTAAIARDR